MSDSDSDMSSISSNDSEFSTDTFASPTESSTGASVSTLASGSSVSSSPVKVFNKTKRGFWNYSFFYKLIALVRYLVYLLWLLMFVIDFCRNGKKRKFVKDVDNEDQINAHMENSFADLFLSPGTQMFWLLSTVFYFFTNAQTRGRSETFTYNGLAFLCLFILIPARYTQGQKFWKFYKLNKNDQQNELENMDEANKFEDFVLRHTVNKNDPGKVVTILQSLSPVLVDEKQSKWTNWDIKSFVSNLFSQSKPEKDAETA